MVAGLQYAAPRWLLRRAACWGQMAAGHAVWHSCEMPQASLIGGLVALNHRQSDALVRDAFVCLNPTVSVMKSLSQ